MAQIIINIPDGIAQRANNLLGRRWGYQSQISNGDNLNPQMIPNPESQSEFNKRKVIEYIKSEAVKQEVDEAGKVAEDTQLPTSESELNIA